MGRERPPRPSQLFLSARFTETCHTSSSSTGTKAVDAGESKTKETEGDRRGERMEKKEEGEGEGGGVKEERGGKKLGKTLKKLASTSPRI